MSIRTFAATNVLKLKSLGAIYLPKAPTLKWSGTNV